MISESYLYNKGLCGIWITFLINMVLTILSLLEHLSCTTYSYEDLRVVEALGGPILIYVNIFLFVSRVQ